MISFTRTITRGVNRIKTHQFEHESEDFDPSTKKPYRTHTCSDLISLSVVKSVQAFSAFNICYG